PGFDSNALRTFASVGGPLCPSEAPVPSAFTMILASGDLTVRGEQSALVLDFMGGAKGFMPAIGASSVAQGLNLTWTLSLPRAMRIGAVAREKTLNTGVNDRDYADAGAVGFIELALAEG